MIASIIYDSRCVMSDVAFRAAPPIGWWAFLLLPCIKPWPKCVHPSSSWAFVFLSCRQWKSNRIGEKVNTEEEEEEVKRNHKHKKENCISTYYSYTVRSLLLQESSFISVDAEMCVIKLKAGGSCVELTNDKASRTIIGYIHFLGDAWLQRIEHLMD